ncbi:protein phosphatase 2A subunit A3 [Perilla frutescens var. hirtella]|nr:protein phosphatase 2A subunit A3 [Perilla frutescens var. frutescens]KAH6776440.1 protein phosphatase 2A subunit A3 [Perilla frutescens var. hirtella]
MADDITLDDLEEALKKSEYNILEKTKGKIDLGKPLNCLVEVPKTVNGSKSSKFSIQGSVAESEALNSHDNGGIPNKSKSKENIQKSEVQDEKNCRDHTPPDLERPIKLRRVRQKKARRNGEFGVPPQVALNAAGAKFDLKNYPIWFSLVLSEKVEVGVMNFSKDKVVIDEHNVFDKMSQLGLGICSRYGACLITPRPLPKPPPSQWHLENARKALSRSAWPYMTMGMALVLGNDVTIEQLLPIFISLLNDEFLDVILNIISKLEQVNQLIRIDLFSQSLLPAVVEQTEDRHWRVRLSFIECLPLLASQGVGFFNDKLGALCMHWLQDKVYSISEATANNLKGLAEEFSPEWAMQHIVPQVLNMLTNPHCLYLMTVLQTISLLALVMGSEITCSNLVSGKADEYVKKKLSTFNS